MPTTTKWGLRFPAGADVPDVPTDMGELAVDVEAALPLSGTIAARPTPAAGRIGATYYATDTGVLSFWTGAAWVDLPFGAGVGAQPGDIKATARSTAPSGWILCDGAIISRATFAALFTAISTAYGAGDGSTTFGIPDLRGRVPVGVDGAAARLAANDGLGQASGADGVTLTSAQSGMVSHNHGGSTSAVDPLGGSLPQTGSTWSTLTGVTGGGAPPNRLPTVDSPAIITNLASLNHSHPIGSQAAADAAQSHNNMPPYQIINWVIKS
jgi:microcystin-dependent protein